MRILYIAVFAVLGIILLPLALFVLYTVRASSNSWVFDLEKTVEYAVVYFIAVILTGFWITGLGALLFQLAT